MDKCKEIRSVILTDYIDGQLEAPEKERINTHLRQCAVCRGFLEEAQKGLVTPFQGQNRQAVPQTLWPAIVEKICQEQEHPVRVFIPRLAPVAVSFLLAVLITSVIFFNQYMAGLREEEQLNYVSSAFGVSQAQTETTSDFGTLIEEYFL
ncbi:MAG: zf-HC2 domain-containing protein [Candidatus Omnitrophica bacterium]|nr:zf-HC2 domain-containing protein [Candidatus Omnitrophota bacterium]MDD5652935.1 zf-HC2 domain-containing protein [Candidatus Omnitrophota bacterium]